MLYEDAPCTDYVGNAAFEDLPGAYWKLDLASSGLGGMDTSPSELLRNVTGIPVLAALIVVLFHAVCCALHACCGADPENDAKGKSGVQEALRDIDLTSDMFVVKG